MDKALKDKPHKGRGAVSNRAGRYERTNSERIDDGWGQGHLQAGRSEEAAAIDVPAGDVDDWAWEPEEEPAPQTQVLPDASKEIIARNSSPDVPFDRSINPYRGCEHGCIYCFARPTHAYWGLSAGLDFETRLFAKHDAAPLLRQALAKPRYRARTVALGANTDPYQPIERRYRITRQVLEVLAEVRHPVGIVTKSRLILRDLDILAPMAAEGLVRVCLSVTTLDLTLARLMEPRAPRPALRLEAVHRLSAAGVPTSVLAAPMIPAINDGELEAILEAAKDAGADGASYVLLRLPLEIADLFAEWLEAHYPDRKKRVLDLVRQSRGGKLYEAQWGKRMRGQGPYAEMIAQRFALASRRLGLKRRPWDLDETKFRPPARDSRQMSLFA